MRRILSITTIVVFSVAPLGSWAQQEQGVRQVTPATIKYQPFPEEKGAQIAVLHGHPGKPGHYIVRLKLAPNWNGRPHVHGGTELLIVQSGTWYVAHGDVLTREAAVRLPAGSFMVIPAETPMRAFTGDQGAVVNIQGQGPFTTRYLDGKQGAGS